MIRNALMRRVRIPVTAALTMALSAGVATTQAYAAANPQGEAKGWSAPAAHDPGTKPGDQPTAVPADRRTAVLGEDYRKSSDRAFTTSGDGTGFHVLVADEKQGYAWKTAATLSESGFDTDSWIGNACLTESGKYAAVAYAPRTFTNKPDLMTRGAFTAVVDLTDGRVTKLPFQATLGYFSPGCGQGEEAVFTALTDDRSAKNQTRLVTVDARTGKVGTKQTVTGQVTSAVPTDQGIVAAEGNHIVAVKAGKTRDIATTKAWPFQLKADAEGGVTFIDADPKAAKTRGAVAAENTATVSRVSAAQIKKADGHGKPAGLAKGKLDEFDLTATPAGTVYVTGKAASTTRAAGGVLRNPGGIDKDAQVSSRGQAVVTSRWADGKDSRIRPEEALDARTVRTTVKALDTRKTVVLDAPPGSDPVGGQREVTRGTQTSPVLLAQGAQPGRSTRAAANDPVEADRYCSVPRNDPKKQAFQPTPRQVEWAVDQAIVGKLNKGATRPANWKNTGMAAYAPQTLFPLAKLAGGSGEDWHVPAQVMLGITAQESNMWQATRLAVPGVTANSLIGNFYGVKYAASGQQQDPWAINFAKADCGYGITQVTDGMRLPNHGESNTKTVTQQEAVALDYAANIAAGVNILIEKWNSTRKDGLEINEGQPKYIENWFYALWAYNSGYHPKSAPENGKWGVGWTNNPANPLWKENRTPFLENAEGKDDYSHAAKPQNWPYEEKVIGWAARPISAMFKPGDMQAGYKGAWWNSDAARTSAKPPIFTFCGPQNDCVPSRISEDASNDDNKGPCVLPGDPHTDNPLYLKCWWHERVAWKNCTTEARCGNPIHRFDDTYPEQPDENSYPPRCNTGLPSGSLIVDDLPNGTVPAGTSGRSCTVASKGSFQFTFAGEGGKYPSKMDLHQIGAGNGNHFWLGHTRWLATADGKRLHVSGKWTLSGTQRGWMRVFVHMPDHGAHTRQAAYRVGGTDSKSPVRVHPQRIRSNKWVDLGVFNFTGTPSVTLDTDTDDGTGDEDIAWDSVAFQPLSAKPKDFVVAMGDSYSSGEGASEGNRDYYPETNYLDKQDDKTRNACHRSTQAWSRQAKIPGRSQSIGASADSYGSAMDYHLIACSGARTYNVWHAGEVQSSGGEKPQIDKGYLDQNTTLVTISIGGNDARFADVIQKCLVAFNGGNCKDKTFEEGDVDQSVGGRDRKFIGQPLEKAAVGVINEIVRPDITKVLTEISAKAPNAKIALMGYPPLIENRGECLSITIPGVGQIGLSASSSDWLGSVADTLATAMQGAVDDAKAKGIKAWFSNPKQNFAGKAVCGDPESVHGIVKTLVDSDKPSNDWPILKGYGLSAQSFHPKIGGARLYADSLERTFTGMGL
ncbi:SGNH/GDSL hydrolase family protein [Streptomyces sp. HD]|uniref:SGNH/GDSL hydrolase family protein n=1 Tax=Streptomyces sp. HD TaxID=3020892 RepID=UPI002330DF2F|nr:SGNH/GDSL hydrolase family protein [Streptomyces sp. HD]MDC0766185.1 SGNH/GDSL hydrolase family protein [Streptomyces sp. HD]